PKNSDKLLLGHNFKILFKIENRPIRVLAKLVRKFNHLSQQFYGFVFIDIRKEDHEFIYRYLYKK
ncbi:MAG TPA: PilZ domain-containing protein, partial [Spirochaetota bacterium]|nr:PilZ domain-containing protein [Spirochaetota bacterium]